jgi:hypothetical protein
MSKKSRRRNKLLLAGAALFGASKLGMLGSKPSGVVGKTPEFRKSFVKDKPIVGKTKEFRKSFTSGKSEFPKLKVDSTGKVTKNGVTSVTKNTKTKFVNRDPNVGSIGIYQGGKKVSGLNQKAINVLSDGKIQKGGKTYADKGAYRKAMDAERLAKKKTGFSKSTNKKNPGFFGFTFDKPLFKKGSMIKARGGGMAKTKPTKMY